MFRKNEMTGCTHIGYWPLSANNTGRWEPADADVIQPGTKVAVHRHLKTSETAICVEGCIDWIFYEELPNVDAGGPIHDGETAADESQFKEVARFRICPREGQFGIQIPKGAWHSIEVHEPSAIFEAKDGAYGR